MACRDAPNFEEYVRKWLYSTDTEAAKDVYDFARSGESLTNAVTFTIESLPARKTVQLRRLVDLFEAYCEWVEEWEPKGWRTDRYDTAKGEVAAAIPLNRCPNEMTYAIGTTRGALLLGDVFPSEEVVAASMGAASAKFSKVLDHPSLVGAVYRLGRSL